MQTTNGSDSTLATSGSTQQTTTPPPPQQWQQQPQQQQQQQWMAAAAAMQYPGAAMMMMQQQQMMMYPHQYVPYNQGPYQQQHHHHHPQLHQYGSYIQHHQHKSLDRGSGDDVKTLWIGDLLHWMDETYLHSCFSHTGEVSSVKVIRNKLTSQSEGYGFVEFLSRAVAEEVLQNYSGSLMPNSEQPFRLNWASFSTGEKRAVESGPDLSVFVGDLSPDVTDDLLHETFSTRYPSVKGAKVVIDSNSGQSKGYGFVRFGDENERSRALTEMNGAFCSNRQMRVGVATPKRAVANQQQHSSQALILAGGHGANGYMAHGSQSDGESTNSTIFVGGIDPDVTDEDLRQPFSQFGDVVSVKIPVGKGCGFVQFADRKSAEDAIESLNGTVIGKNTVRLSWGRTPNKQQWRGGDSGQQWNGGYSRGQGYNNGGGYANHHESNTYHGET
ncbi:PREDICTED: polyadenylate-binding protein RBP47B-like isoform X2 [Camelina sativa]|uniref:Polyadenylate-binding protein RBP47B-like isoform X1 n=1 Tax=Camelina sativa TaxID=90675 RepID=A0ABM1R112_CAMSA|nr:PREDICTED: polyadenylate-binding protein RBP47B-like isoform X1 [Camelina sativa]XP_019092701.1 PREDICTED: polyadenylate-binding protein RBP47B-like isoform X2 [Camelina sativa]